MPVFTKKTRKAVIAVGVLAVIALAGVAALAWYGYVVDSRNPYGGHNSYGMRDYTPHDEENAAKAIIAGLNTHNPDRVELTRNHSGDPDREADNARIADNIGAVLPPPDCKYSLVNVEDRGEQPPSEVPWFSGPTHAWGFDMNLRQLCPGHQPTPRTIRVIAIAGMGGYWTKAALYDEPASRS
jgi:hypothetical protein